MGTTSGCAANDVLSATHRAKMDKRMGWNLDTTEHATFNWIRPIPACSKVGSQFNPAPITVVDTARIISGPTLHMRVFNRRFVFRIGVVLLILFWATALGPEPPARCRPKQYQKYDADPKDKSPDIDIVLGDSARTGTSRAHFHFAERTCKRSHK